MKKLLALLLALLLCGCALAEPDPNAALLDIAQDMARELTGLCAVKGYASFFLSEETVLAQIEAWGGDWAAPENRARAAVAFLSRDALLAALPVVLSEADVSDDILNYADPLLLRLSTAPASLINSRIGGMQFLAAASVATLSQVRALEGQDSGVALALLDYGAEHPIILVSFCIAPDGAASIGASFLVNGDYTDAVFAALQDLSTLRGLVASAEEALTAEQADALNHLLDAARVLMLE